jgi:hypothetical protein
MLYILQITVAIWYMGSLYTAGCLFGIANRFKFCSLQRCNFVQQTALYTADYIGNQVLRITLFNAAYRVKISYSGPLYILQVTVVI